MKTVADALEEITEQIKLQAQKDVLKYIEQTDRDYPIAVAVARAEAEVNAGRLCVPLSDEAFARKRNGSLPWGQK